MGSLRKVSYRPIEAAIRWSGLLRHESQILARLQDRGFPEPDELASWPALRLNTERIYDAIANGELAVAINGVKAPSPTAIDHPDLSIRHVDLKFWIQRFYPGHRPAFLFTARERVTRTRRAPLAAMIAAVHAQSVRSGVLLENLHAQLSGTPRKALQPASCAGATGLSPRSEATYLNIVGGLLQLLLGHAPSGQPYSSFRTQDAVISALIAHQGDRLGISERTLAAKFAAARRELTK